LRDRQRGLVRGLALASALVGGLVALTGAATATTVADTVVAYPSSQSISPNGALPRGGSSYVTANAAVGEQEDAIVVVRGAKRVSVTVATAPVGGIGLRLFLAHFVAVDGGAVPDALEPWDGSERATERPNQPIHVQVDVPYGTKPGRYAASLAVTADGLRTTVPIRMRVFPVTLPRPGTRAGNLLTSFNLSPESFVSKSAQLYGFTSHEQRVAANRALFALLGTYRVSPGSWGFGEPRSASGYATNSRWWLDSAGNFLGQLRASPGFSALRIPISSNRAAAHNYIAQMSPFAPETWCEYLRRVHSFWSENEVLGAAPLTYLFGYDEPSLAGQRVVARQARALHECFPGGAQLMTGNPTAANTFLWDGKGGDDLDVWTVLSRRYYGTWTSPAHTRAGKSRARSSLALIDKVRSRGKMVWGLHVHRDPRHARPRCGGAALEPAHARALDRAGERPWPSLRTGDDELHGDEPARVDRKRREGSRLPGGRTGRGRARASRRSGTASRTGPSSICCGSGGARPRSALCSETRACSVPAARACASPATSGVNCGRRRSTRGRAGRATPQRRGGSKQPGSRP
jgi:hypothetical protein